MEQKLFKFDVEDIKSTIFWGLLIYFNLSNLDLEMGLMPISNNHFCLIRYNIIAIFAWRHGKSVYNFFENIVFHIFNVIKATLAFVVQRTKELFKK